MASIRAKIVVPFTALFVLAILAVAFLAAHATAQNVEARLQEQMADLASVLSQAALARKRPVLEQVKTIVGGELATVDAGGAVLATTLDAAAARELGDFVAASPPGMPTGAVPTRHVRLGGTSYRATFAPIRAAEGREGEAFLYLLAPEAGVRTATWRAIRPILVAAACGALVVAAIGYLVAHRIARPIEALATRMRGLAANASEGEAAPKPKKRDEVKELSEAFGALLESLRRAEARLVGSERLAAVGQVAAAIGHEVRNPLSGIKMSAQLVGRKLADAGSPEDESVRVMLAEIARLEVILDDLLTFAGPGQLACEPGDVNEVVREVLYFMHRQLTHASVIVDDQLADPLPEVPHDAQRIRQVVLNLVLNATEAMPAGGTLTVRTRATGEGVAVGVEDTGRGIPAETAERIFEPFFTTKKDGSGLGLAVSRLIVEAHGGTLRYEPTGVGSRFVFELPRKALSGQLSAVSDDEAER